MPRCVIVALLFFLILISPAWAQLPAGFIQTKVAGGLDAVRMVEAEDGRIFIAEKKGTIRIIKNGVLLPDPMMSIAVDNIDERGLAGITLDPDFGNNQYFYLYYSVPGENHNRVSRFKSSGDFADPASETILIDLDGLWWQVHNGGSLAFGLDRKLYISVGDGANTNGGPQNLSSTLGKILRINSDGSIPTDNPFYNSTTDKFRSIYAIGFRNPFSMTVHPVTGQIIVGDVGNNSYEELNTVIAGKNYGWPMIEGPVQPGQVVPENYQPPLYYYDHNVGCSVIGGAFYVPSVPSFPSNYDGKYFFTDFCNGKITVADPLTGNIPETFATGVPYPSHVYASHDGSLYYISRGTNVSGDQEGNTVVTDGAIWRIQYTGSGVPYISDNPSGALIPVGETATFNVRASGTNPLSFQWFRNGIEIDGATGNSYTTPVASIEDNGTLYSVKIFNAEGEVTSTGATLTVTNNTRPVVTIESPPESFMYNAGNILSLKGNAVDNEDGILAGTKLTWVVTFHHNDHTHPGLSPTTGQTATFEIPRSGETSANVWYEVSLTAVDNEGLSGNKVINIYPNKSTMTFETSPPGLQLKLDGQTIETPLQVEGVVKALRSLEAPAVIYDSLNMYRFLKWSNNVTSNPITLSTPLTDSTITATYTTLELGDGNGLTGEYFNGKDKTFDFTGAPDTIRVDENLYFDWDLNSPVPGKINTNQFTARWTGYLKVPFDGNYTFTLRTDDGSRLYFNDKMLIDNWLFSDFRIGSEMSESIGLEAGKMYRVKVEYYESQSLAVAKLFWASDSIPKSIIPHNQFFLSNPTNQAPEATFAAPADNFKFAAGPFSVKALSTDAEDGVLDPRKAVWTVDIHHDEHVHNLVNGLTGVDSLIVDLPPDHSYEDISFFRITMTISDPEGLTTTITRDIYPNIVALNITTKPVGLWFMWNNRITTTAPTGLQGTLGILQVAPQVVLNETVFDFYGWEGTVSPFFRTNTTILELNEGSIVAVYNGQPKVQFIEPKLDQQLIHNQTISFKGGGFDIEDDVMPPSSFSWRVVLYDETMTADTIFRAEGIEQLEYSAQLSHLKSTNGFGRVFFTATDSRNAKASISTDLAFSFSRVNLAASLPDVSITIDDASYPFPYEFSSINGVPHSYFAQKRIVIGNEVYVFDQWSNGATDNPIVYVTTASDTTFTAQYKLVDDVFMGTKVHPNPVTSEFNMDWGAMPGTFTLSDNLGKAFLTGYAEAFESLKINLSENAPGMYYLKLTVESQQRTIKILKL